MLHISHIIQHYVKECNARGSIRISGIPQDACDSLDDRLTQPLEPFNINEAVPFSPVWLSGLDAKIYDVNSEHGLYQILKRVHTSFEIFLTDAKKYDYFAGRKQDYRLVHHRMLYALFPVWTAEVEWENDKETANYLLHDKKQTFTFTMNGQTGKCVGHFPVCTKKNKYLCHKLLVPLSVLLLPLADTVSFLSRDNHAATGSEPSILHCGNSVSRMVLHKQNRSKMFF